MVAFYRVLKRAWTQVWVLSSAWIDLDVTCATILMLGSFKVEDETHRFMYDEHGLPLEIF